MTTTVIVRSRAWGARVEVQGQEPLDLGAHQDHAIQISEGESQTITVTHGEQPAENPVPFEGEEVPGRAENDRLLGNESGATETSQTTDGEGEQPVSVPPRGRGSRPSTDPA